MHDRLVNLLGAAGLATVDLADAAEDEAGGRNPSRSAALITLAREPEIGATELARHIKLTQPAVSRLVDGLQAEGLIERGAGAGRSVPLRLTKKGLAAVRSLLEARQQALAALVASLNEEETEALERVLEKVLDNAYEQIRSGFVLCRQCDHVACTTGGASCPVTRARKRREQQ